MTEKKIYDWIEYVIDEDLEITSYWTGKQRPYLNMQRIKLRGNTSSADLTLRSSAVLTPKRLRELADQIEKQEAMIVLKGGTEY